MIEHSGEGMGRRLSGLLAAGRQSILVRKEAIAEPWAARFGWRRRGFWMWPTHVHQAETGVRADERRFQEEAERDRPVRGMVRISEWAEVTGVYQIRDAVMAQMLAHLHVWSEEAIAKRYAYRTPGVDVLSVRVHRMPAPIEIAETAEHAGCKSWVELGRGYPTTGSTAVLTDDEYRDVVGQLDTLLRPTRRCGRGGKFSNLPIRTRWTPRVFAHQLTIRFGRIGKLENLPPRRIKTLRGTCTRRDPIRRSAAIDVIRGS